MQITSGTLLEKVQEAFQFCWDKVSGNVTLNIGAHDIYYLLITINSHTQTTALYYEHEMEIFLDGIKMGNQL